MKPWLLFFVGLCLAGLVSCKKDTLHWQVASQINSNTTDRLNKILFINDSVGFIVGGSRFASTDILTTHDGGHTFSLQTFPAIGKALYDITKAPDGQIFTVGYEGRMLKSSDQGQTWSAMPLFGVPFTSITATSDGKIFAVGGINFSEGQLYYGTESGKFISYDTFSYQLNQIHIQPDGIGYRCGYGTLGKTTDNGLTWTLQSPIHDNFIAMDLHSSQELWICGYNGSVYHTTNGGGDWNELRNGNDLTHPRYHLQDLLFLDESHGYAVGEEGVVIYSDDGGQHWIELDRFTDQTLHSIVKCPDGDLLVCGEGGTIFRLRQQL